MMQSFYAFMSEDACHCKLGTVPGARVDYGHPPPSLWTHLHPCLYVSVFIVGHLKSHAGVEACKSVYFILVAPLCSFIPRIKLNRYMLVMTHTGHLEVVYETRLQCIFYYCQFSRTLGQLGLTSVHIHLKTGNSHRKKGNAL